MENLSESTLGLIKRVCEELNIPIEKPSVKLLAKVFTAATCIRLPDDLSESDLICKIVSILSEEIIRAPLDHIIASNVLSGEDEAVFDLLEIISTCIHLRDDSLTTTSSADMTTPDSSASSSSPSLYSAFSSLRSSRDSLLSSESSCSTCNSVSGIPEVSNLTSSSTIFSEATQDYELPCILCEFLSNSIQHEMDLPVIVETEPTLDSGQNSSKPVASSSQKDKPMDHLTVKPVVRPSKLVRSEPSQDAVKNVRIRLAQSRGLRATAAAATNQFQQQKKTSPVLKPKNDPPAHFNDVIRGQSIKLKPRNMPAPENGLQDGMDIPNHQLDVDDDPIELKVSPHLTRVLRKQYDHHLQWMASNGVSESGLKKIEREYEDLIDRHTTRVKQMRREACDQNRVNLMKAQKGVSHTVRNLRLHAKHQANQLAHAKLETERIQRSKEAKMRLAEEKLLRETFVEAMRIQKQQLLDLRQQMAEDRLREEDKHRIYMNGLEHFYKTQLDMLAEALDKQNKDGKIRNGAHIALLRAMRKELKEKLDKEIVFLKDIVAMDET